VRLFRFRSDVGFFQHLSRTVKFPRFFFCFCSVFDIRFHTGHFRPKFGGPVIVQPKWKPSFVKSPLEKASVCVVESAAAELRTAGTTRLDGGFQLEFVSQQSAGLTIRFAIGIAALVDSQLRSKPKRRWLVDRHLKDSPTNSTWYRRWGRIVAEVFLASTVRSDRWHSSIQCQWNQCRQKHERDLRQSRNLSNSLSGRRSPRTIHLQRDHGPSQPNCHDSRCQERG